MQRIVSIYTSRVHLTMHREITRLVFPIALGREMGVVVHGHWGPPMILFPTTGGDEGEYERQSLIGAIAESIDAGRVKTFCVNINNGDSFGTTRAHPLHRSWMQRQYDAYIRHEVIPVRPRAIASPTTSAIWTMGASLGGYHAANTLFKYPDVVKRCFALSGVYDMKRFMDGAYDDNFYFNNPVDYMANVSDRWGCSAIWRAATSTSPPAPDRGSTAAKRTGCRASSRAAASAITSTTGDRIGGHDWPYWRHQMREYLNYV